MENEITVYDKEKLFDNVYWFLCEQYTKGNPLHFLMFVGLDGELSYDMANYILHHRYYNGALRCIDYHSNEDIVKHLSQMHFGDVFLLNGLEKASTVALIPIVRKIEEIQYNSNNTCDEFGTLIINTTNPNVLPEYIRKYFDIITLEPEITPEKQKRKMPRGQKRSYAGQEEYTAFLREINDKYKNCSLPKKANMVISQMEGRRLYLDENGKPIYAKSTIKRQLSELGK